MKEKISNQNILYPMPVAVVGTMVNGKPNFITIAHVGILTAEAPYMISLGFDKSHYTSVGIKETKTFSVNLMSVNELVRTDYVGTESGSDTDKSQVFETFIGELETPIIKNCPLSIECKLYDVYKLPNGEVFIGETIATYAEKSVLVDGKVDVSKVNPLLFDMSGLQYLSLGQTVGNAWGEASNYK
jgi:flavin reductase (DIM6/NTAB) family NADH-FMN oxidoreductase RutF